MLRNATLFSQTEIASAFLSVDRAFLFETDLPNGDALDSLAPEDALTLLATKRREWKRWRESVASRYSDAFNCSGRVVDAKREIQNFKELKRVNQAGTGLHLFLALLLAENNTAPVTPKEAAEKLRRVKKEREKVTNDNAVLVASLSAQYEELMSTLHETHDALEEVVQRAPLEPALAENAARRQALERAIGEEERRSAALLSDLRGIDCDAAQFEASLAQEISEAASLTEMIRSQTQDTQTKQERKEQRELKVQQQLAQLDQLSRFLERVGGTEIEGTTANPLTLKLRTDVGGTLPGQDGGKTVSFIHHLKLELHPSSYLVSAAQLVPGEKIAVKEIAVGQSLTSAVSHVRSLLFLSLQRRQSLAAFSAYKFTQVHGEESTWRVALPQGVEIEMKIPLSWPFEQSEGLELLEIQSLCTSVHFEPLKAKLQTLDLTDLHTFLQTVSHEIRTFLAFA